MQNDGMLYVFLIYFNNITYYLQGPCPIVQNVENISFVSQYILRFFHML